MHRKLTLAILAAVSLSAIALAPTAASARHFGGGGGGNFHRDHFDHFNHFNHFDHFGHFGHQYGIGYVGGGGYDNGWLQDPSGADAVRLPRPHRQYLRY